MREIAWWGWPLLLIGLAYVWLMCDTGMLVPWQAIVHEDGRRTLERTLLYPRHFLREIPVALFYVAAVAAALGLPVRASRSARGVTALVAAGLLAAAAWFTVVRSHGLAVALGDLGQFYTHDTRGGPGAHWGVHYGSNLVFIGAAWILASPRRPASTALWPIVALALVGTASIVFCKAPAEAILAPRAAAHQAREIFTHVPITLPLAMYGLVGQSRQSDGQDPSGHVGSGLFGFGTPDVWWTMVVVVSITAILAAIALGGRALEQVPATWSARVAGHVFEHGLDLVFVVLLSLGLRAGPTTSRL